MAPPGAGTVQATSSAPRRCARPQPATHPHGAMGNYVSVAEADAPAEDAATEPVSEKAYEDAPEGSAGEDDAGEDGEGKPEIKIWTAPVDRRFPSVNQARTCYTRYNEYYKCAAEKSEEQCTFYKKCYQSLCPIEWIERWEEQREEGTWPGRY
ncbi:unnamed protein product [Ostreobium quekettii]|uniref:Uncharacterized protein n=1 Tax=Ostreobium quekettii TaxID=121088 RepID=A0A8S1JES6_9CHLO|nr:unnamed protein product [Ostreobium quekettii]|eukprot:evm.model.scf_1716EXC.1 EVM.evm.TU.scf_1716EXC.1   scf_1716EXC:267-1588(+)